jgi:hypothetical protein
LLFKSGPVFEPAFKLVILLAFEIVNDHRRSRPRFFLCPIRK